MKKKSLLFFAAVGLAPALSATVTVEFLVGKLLAADAVNTAPENSLIQILAMTLGAGFEDPTAVSFTGGNNNSRVLYSFGLDSSTTGISGTFNYLPPSSLSLTGGLATGNQLLVRWFPTLDINSAAPGLGTKYGQYRTDLIFDDTDGSGSGWVLPAEGESKTLRFLTLSEGGSVANAAGVANRTVTVVPESDYAVAGLATLATAALVRRRRKSGRV